jgi:hypothetical protein
MGGFKPSRLTPSLLKPSLLKPSLLKPSLLKPSLLKPSLAAAAETAKIARLGSKQPQNAAPDKGEERVERRRCC